MPKIDVSKIEGYGGMTAEQKIAALEAYEYEENHEGYVKKELLDKASTEAASYKQQLRDKMTADEKKAAEDKEKHDKLMEELNALRLEKTIATYKSSFLALGYEEKLADETAKAMAEGDTAKVLANQKLHQEAREAQIKKDILKDTPTPPAGGGNNEITKEQFAKMSLDEKTDLYNKNPEMFHKLAK